MDRDRKREILAAENAERLGRALAAKGVYVLGGLGRHGMGPAGEGAEAVVGQERPATAGDPPGTLIDEAVEGPLPVSDPASDSHIS